MKAISGKHFCRVLEQHGFVLNRVQGSHHIFKHPETGLIISVPVHAGKDLKAGTLRALMRYSGLSESDF